MEIKEYVTNSDPIFSMSWSGLSEIIETAKKTKRRRFRVNVHQSNEDSLHQMIIVHEKDCYVRAHKHSNKVESFHIIRGQLKVIVFDDDGQILEVVSMSDSNEKDAFCYRSVPGTWHTVLIESEWAVFHEITNGPFVPGANEFADWAPEEGSIEAENYYKNLKEKVKEFLNE